MSSQNETFDKLSLLPLVDSDHRRGPSNARVTLVEFGDYECPGCGEAYRIFERLERELTEPFQFVFRHYAYARIHPHAEQAAQAAEAAGAQGRFWEMHDLLFADQSKLATKDLVARAEQLKLDLDRFRQELKKAIYLDKVRDDFKTGVQNGVFGTPGIFVNGVRCNESWSEETLKEAIALAAATNGAAASAP